MTHVNPDDGICYLDRNEHYHVTGYVTVKVWVDFETSSEPGDPDFEEDLNEAVADFEDWEIEDSDDLDLEVEVD